MSKLVANELRSVPPVRHRNGWLRNGTVQGGLLAGLGFVTMSGGLFWVVSIYEDALRDPRYLDGWLLAGGMTLQLLFHIALKTARLSQISVARWRRVHIFVGYLLVAAFISHMDLSLPDTVFEWALATGFVLVTISGIVGAYILSSVKSARERGLTGSHGQFTARRAEILRAVRTVVADANVSAADAVLPAPPFQAWIGDLYVTHLHDHFDGHGGVAVHLIGSQRPLLRVTEAIDALLPYVDRQSQGKLESIKALAIEKHRLDFNQVQNALARGWPYVHVAVTYGLMVLTVLHILVVYAYSSGVW